MVKKKKKSGVSISKNLAVELQSALAAVAFAIRENTAVMEKLAQPSIVSTEALRRLNGWMAAELDRKNTGKAAIENMPAVLALASQENLNHLLSEPVREFQAMLVACEESLRLSSAKNVASSAVRDRRDITGRWPNARLP